jgi:hypothetical protein
MGTAPFLGFGFRIEDRPLRHRQQDGRLGVVGFTGVVERHGLAAGDQATRLV